MKRNNTFSYDVTRNEQITITVTPKKFKDSKISVRANRDGKVFPRRPGTEDAPVFQFTVSKPLDDPPLIHTVIMEFTFLAGSPSDAVYEVDISGENDQGCPCGFKIKKTTSDKEPDIRFFVVA